jgi:putative transposase
MELIQKNSKTQRIKQENPIIKAYKFRLYPTKQQIELIEKSFSNSNFIYNYFLSDQKEIDNVLTMYGLSNKKEKSTFKTNNNLWFNKFEASKKLTQMANSTHPFLSITDSSSRSMTLDSLDKAFKNIKKTGAGFPQFKSNKNNIQSYTGSFMYNGKSSPQNFKLVKTNNKKRFLLSVPKIKNIPSVIHIQDFINNWNDINKMCIIFYTISKNVQQEYFISITVDEGKSIQELKPIEHSSSIGIDMGVQRPITTSDPNDFNNNIFSQRFDIIKKQKENITKLERILATKREKNKNWKNSAKYKKLKNKLSKIHGKITKQRNNIQNVITSSIANKPTINTFVLEDLNVKNMTKKSAKGKSNNKKHLSKAILDVGWHSIVSKLTYKANWLGKNVVKVNPAFTSQKCSSCGHINKLSRLSQETYHCSNCNTITNADFNAAINIKNKFFNI